MPLVTTRMVPRGHLMSTDIKQYADLLTGVMTDQPVKLAATLQISGVVDPPGGAGIEFAYSSNVGYIQAYDRTAGAWRNLSISAQDVLLTPRPTGTVRLGGTTTAAGNVLFATDNTHDIGAAGASRPRSLYLANSLVVPTTVLTSYTQMAGIGMPAAPPAGSFRLYPKTDGLFYQLNSAGVETPLLAVDKPLRTYIQQIMSVLDPGGAPPPPP